MQAHLIKIDLILYSEKHDKRKFYPKIQKNSLMHPLTVHELELVSS